MAPSALRPSGRSADARVQRPRADATGVALVVAGFVLLAQCVVGCIGPESSGGPPLRVCGTTLWDGAGTTRAFPTEPGMAPITSEGPDGRVYLKVSPSCATGVAVTVPPTAATIDQVARAQDGLAAAVAIKPLTPDFVVTVSSGNSSYQVQVKLQQ